MPAADLRAGPAAAGDLQDPTICPPEVLAQIENEMRVSLKDTPPEVLQFVVDRSKQAGNAAFKEKNYKEAVKMYSQAIAGNPKDHTLFGNRSAAFLAMGLYEDALLDATKCTQLKPDWAKGHYRLGCVLLALSQWAAAAEALERGAELEPGNADMASKLSDARARAAADARARRAQADTERRSLVFKLRAARRADRKLSAVNQFKQAMTAPDYELEDLDWRPTFLPSMKLHPLNKSKVYSDPKKALLLSYLAQLADLAQPKQALGLLSDEQRVAAFQAALGAAVTPGEHVLVLGAGTGLLALLAAGAGAGRVTGVERSRSLYRMARQTLESNAERGGGVAGAVHLIDRKLQGVGVKGEELPPEVKEALQALRKAQQAQQASQPPAGQSTSSKAPLPDVNGQAAAGATSSSSSGSAEEAQQQQQQGSIRGGKASGSSSSSDLVDVVALLPRRASLLVTDLLDYSVLGMGLLPAVDYAARHLLTPGARVLPKTVKVTAVLVEILTGEVSGFDLSALNTYRWFPHHERTKLDRVPHRVLSAPFQLHTLDLQARVDRLTSQASAQQAQQAEQAEHAAAPSGGQAKGGSSAEAAAGEGAREGLGGSSRGSSSSSSAAEAGLWEWDESLEVQVTAEGTWNAVAFWFDAELSGSGGGQDGEGPVVVSSYGEGREGVAAASSWGQAVQYVDAAQVAKGATVKLHVRQDSGQYVFTTQPPQCRPHHALVPRWHFDMVLDGMRNDAYDSAIRRAVARTRECGVSEVMALDIGAGSGLLSMMAVRAGAASVVAAEVSAHMCDVGEEATIMNGFLGKITMLDRDARRLDVVRKPDGTPPDMPRRADLLVYEVFDSGLIGEGVLHLLHAAKHKLLTAGAALVPLSATVYCQPIQMRVGEVAGWDMQQANRYRWRPDYEGVELGQCRDEWVPLAEPQQVFHFDFHEVDRNMQPSSDCLTLTFNQAGVFNAVAMWFELHLDEETQLSTSPYLEKGPTWQQAVQWVDEVRVEPGLQLRLTARHDTYSISFGLEDNDAEELIQRSTGVPLKDPVWESAFSGLQELNSQLVRACVQNPREYRAVAEAAVQFASRPHDLGLDAQTAADFCMRMMG